MAEQTIKAIRTQAGDLQIDYTALANKPTPKKFTDSVTNGDFADAKSFKDKIDSIGAIDTSKFVPKTTTINNKPLTGNITLTASDLGISNTGNNYNADDITSGTLSMDNGGTGADSGMSGLKNLLADGPMILSYNQYGTELPSVPSTPQDKEALRGAIFFVKV